MKEPKGTELATNDAVASSPEIQQLQPQDEEHISDLGHQYRRVPGKPPLAAWLVSLVTIGERWSYYAFLGPFRMLVKTSPLVSYH